MAYLLVLLTNLRVQERQSRVCSTVAIAIVAETCGRKCQIHLVLQLALTMVHFSFHMYSGDSQRVPYR